MNTKEIEIGLRYRVSGDLSNGHYADGTPCIIHEDVVRVKELQKPILFASAVVDLLSMIISKLRSSKFNR